MRMWMLLGALLFATRCFEGTKPMLQSITGDDVDAASETEDTTLTPRSPSQGLRLASWNLEWLSNEGSGVIERNDSDFTQLRRYAQRLDPDIVAVQEVAQAEALARIFTPDRYRIYLARQGRAQRTGFAYRKDLDVRIMPDLDALAERGLRAGADVSVTVNGKVMRLLALHLKASCIKKPLDGEDEDCQRLAEQVPIVEDWIDDRARAGEAFVVLGDFNRFLDDDDDVWRDLNDGEPQGLTLKRTAPTLGSLCKSQRSPRRFVDHIVLGGHAASWLVRDSFRELRYDPADKQARVRLSDHCPILIELEKHAP